MNVLNSAIIKNCIVDKFIIQQYINKIIIWIYFIFNEYYTIIIQEMR